jgi:hypothetical protein
VLLLLRTVAPRIFRTLLVSGRSPVGRMLSRAFIFAAGKELEWEIRKVIRSELNSKQGDKQHEYRKSN